MVTSARPSNASNSKAEPAKENAAAAFRAKVIAEEAGQQNREAAKERKERAAAGGLRARHAGHLGEVGGDPEIEGFAQQRGAERKTADQPEGVGAEQGAEDGSHAWLRASGLHPKKG